MVILQDLAFPDPGRDLQGPSDSSDDSGSPFHMQIVFCVAGGALLLLLCAIWCVSSVRSGWATRGANASTSAPVRPQDERAGDAIQSTLPQRKHAILELFRTSRVTMKLIDEDINNGASNDQCNEDIESGGAGGTLTLSRAAATTLNNLAPTIPLSAPPPETVPNCCAICLESYHPGEVIAWSSSCLHVFHQDCIARYLSTKLIGEDNMPCPSCRQKFCDLPEAILEPTTSSDDSGSATS